MQKLQELGISIYGKEVRETEVMKERRMYEVEIVETLCKIESVEADSIEDAIEQVEELYSSSDIVLGSGEFVDVDFMPSQEEKLKMKRNLRSR